MQKVAAKQDNETRQLNRLRKRQRARIEGLIKETTGRRPRRAKCGVFIDGWLAELPAICAADLAPYIEWQILCSHLKKHPRANVAKDLMRFILPLAAAFHFVAVERRMPRIARELRGVVTHVVSKFGRSAAGALAAGKKQCAVWAVVAAAEREAERRGLDLGGALDAVNYIIED